MKTWRLVSGILNCVLFCYIMFQSFAAGLFNTLDQNGQHSGSTGVLFGILFLAAAILSIVGRRGGKGGNISILALYVAAALLGIMGHGSYGDLLVWGIWSGVCALVAAVAFVAGYGEPD